MNSPPIWYKWAIIIMFGFYLVFLLIDFLCLLIFRKSLGEIIRGEE